MRTGQGPTRCSRISEKCESKVTLASSNSEDLKTVLGDQLKEELDGAVNEY